ncbi:MAG: hypothetical protein ABIT09_01410 [Croceibacterium sp.]
MREMLRHFGGKSASLANGHNAAIAAQERLAMLDAFEEADLAWFWATDSDNRLIYLSPSALKKLGPTRSVIGEPLTALGVPVSERDAEAPERPFSFLLSARNPDSPD